MAGKAITRDELVVLMAGENFIHTKGSFHMSEIEVLLLVCRVRGDCEVRNVQNNLATNYDKLYRHFPDKTFHVPSQMSKYLTASRKLVHFPRVLAALKEFFATSLRVADWGIAHIRPAPLWKLPEDDLLVVIGLINAGTLASEESVRKHLSQLSFRADLLVRFPLSLFSLDFR